MWQPPGTEVRHSFCSSLGMVPPAVTTMSSVADRSKRCTAPITSPS